MELMHANTNRYARDSTADRFRPGGGPDRRDRYNRNGDDRHHAANHAGHNYSADDAGNYHPRNHAQRAGDRESADHPRNTANHARNHDCADHAGNNADHAGNDDAANHADWSATHGSMSSGTSAR